MDLTNLLVDSKAHPARRTSQPAAGPAMTNGRVQDNKVMPSLEASGLGLSHPPALQHPQMASDGRLSGGTPSRSPTKNGKHVTFELLLNEATRHRARLPMRVNIYAHDTTDSIVATVKNFYGLYESGGISFENGQGDTLIARFENFDHGMTIYVRTTNDSGSSTEDDGQDNAVSPRRPRLDEPFEGISRMRTPSRPSSRTARRRSVSPQSSHSKRSVSTHAKMHSRMGLVDQLNDAANGNSDSDEGSVTSSRRAKNDLLTSAEISLDNIVEGGRRKRAKFDSSELPLFVPPQVPMSASIPSVSPQRKVETPYTGPAPSHSSHPSLSYNYPLPSPHSNGNGENAHMYGNQLATPTSAPPGRHGHKLRTRAPLSYSARHSLSVAGILPTPDPTIGGSVISDEDAALQLMRLGDLSNFSSHGRTSTSTMDDALSGKAEIASSDEGEDSEMEEADMASPHAAWNGRHASEANDASSDDYNDGRIQLGYPVNKLGIDAGDHSFQPLAKKQRLNPPNKVAKSSKPRANSPKKPKSGPASMHQPISPASLPQSRKQSINSVLLGKTPQLPLAPPNTTPAAPVQRLAEDEEDLSAKPRCQRCRKSKKGCDRQRPCGRCKDAGIGIEGCVSEDEGNGRKGRYGRHMGVIIKKEGGDSAHSTAESSPLKSVPYQVIGPQPTAYAPMGAPLGGAMAGMSGMIAPPMAQAGDKSKKRKR